MAYISGYITALINDTRSNKRDSSLWAKRVKDATAFCRCRPQLCFVFFVQLSLRRNSLWIWIHPDGVFSSLRTLHTCVTLAALVWGRRCPLPVSNGQLGGFLRPFFTNVWDSFWCFQILLGSLRLDYHEDWFWTFANQFWIVHQTKKKSSPIFILRDGSETWWFLAPNFGAETETDCS